MFYRKWGIKVLQNIGNKLYRIWAIKYYTDHEENVKQNIGHNFIQNIGQIVIQNIENAMLYRIKKIKCDTKQEGKCYTENWENDKQNMGNKNVFFRILEIKCYTEHGE